MGPDHAWIQDTNALDSAGDQIAGGEAGSQYDLPPIAPKGSPMILLISRHDDFDAIALQRELEARSVDSVLFDPGDLPREAQIRISTSSHGWDGVLLTRSGSIALSSINTIWFGLPHSPGPFKGLPLEDARLAQQEWECALRTLWELLSDRIWINSVSALRWAEMKPFQLATAADVGLDIPDTLITNRAQDLIRFNRLKGGQIVYKSLEKHERIRAERKYALRTTRIGADVSTLAQRVQWAPGLFQPYVGKAAEIRATVVGQEVLAAEISSPNDAGACDDWKRGLDERSIRPVDLPSAVRSKLIRLCARLELRFAATDLIRTPEDRYVFLEANPRGSWYWIQARTGLPISAHLAALLIRNDPDHAAQPARPPKPPPWIHRARTCDVCTSFQRYGRDIRLFIESDTRPGWSCGC